MLLGGLVSIQQRHGQHVCQQSFQLLSGEYFVESSQQLCKESAPGGAKAHGGVGVQTIEQVCGVPIPHFLAHSYRPELPGEESDGCLGCLEGALVTQH